MLNINRKKLLYNNIMKLKRAELDKILLNQSISSL